MGYINFFPKRQIIFKDTTLTMPTVLSISICPLTIIFTKEKAHGISFTYMSEQYFMGSKSRYSLITSK